MAMSINVGVNLCQLLVQCGTVLGPGSHFVGALAGNRLKLDGLQQLATGARRGKAGFPYLTLQKGVFIGWCPISVAIQGCAETARGFVRKQLPLQRCHSSASVPDYCHECDLNQLPVKIMPTIKLLTAPLPLCNEPPVGLEWQAMKL